MYDDPKHIKDNRINARFDDIEIEDITLVARLAGVQKSTLVRQATLKLIAELKKDFESEVTLLTEAC